MVKLIVAIANENAIGKDNDLLWHLPADMKFFTQTTTGHVVIMGRKNWDSIPEKYQPLPNRINAVVTRNETYTNNKADVFHSMEDAIEHYKSTAPDKDIFIIGGGEIYKYALQKKLVNEMFVTFVHADFEADTFFPEIDEEEWSGELLFEHKADEKNKFDFDVYQFLKN